MPPARTRTVVPLPDDDMPETLGESRARRRRARDSAPSQLRRIQSATADPKVRLPEEDRAIEDADGDLKAQIAGRYFRVAETIGLMPLMEWAASQDSVDGSNQTQLAGLFRVVKDLVAPEDWDEFKVFTRDKKCTDTDFVAFVNAAIEAIAARPTEEPETS